MERKHLLAAELFAYSFANYEDHLGIGNLRFEQRMPEEALLLERAEDEGWSDAQVVAASEVPAAEVGDVRRRFRRARAVVDAPDAAAAFRAGVRFSIEDAIADGLMDEPAVDRLVTQVCYRAADLAFLLDREAKALSDYSTALRAEPNDEPA